MAAMGNNSSSSSVNSDSESVITEEVVQNVEGNFAGAAFKLGALRPFSFFCNPGDDIIMKISVVSENHNHTSVCMRAHGNVMGPSIQWRDNGSRKYEGVYTLLDFNGYIYPFALRADVPSRQFNISFAGPDGQLFGGKLSGSLIAASQIHVFLFVPAEDSDDDTDPSEDADYEADASDNSESDLSMSSVFYQ